MVARAYASLIPAHEAAIRIASRSRRHTSTAKDHSPGLIAFLSRELRMPPPQPSYLERPIESASHIPEEMPSDAKFEEGAAIQVLVNRYERDPAARARCIEHYGSNCIACGSSLADRYGQEVDGLIHVHHLTPLASIKTRSSVDPISDLRPVCPNCHAVIHSKTPPRTIEEVRKMVRKQKL
jgi:5-methylcytosine-specific restriction enzyme A